MSVRLENKELNIYSFTLGDLTVKQIAALLEEFEEGARLRGLTMFFNKDNGLLLINREQPKYEMLLALAQNYLSASETRRKEITVSEDEQQAMNVLENCVRTRKCNKDWKAVEENWIPDDVCVMDMLNRIRESANRSLVKNQPIFALHRATANAFLYGMMYGKRQERAKRKQGASR